MEVFANIMEQCLREFGVHMTNKKPPPTPEPSTGEPLKKTDAEDEGRNAKHFRPDIEALEEKVTEIEMHVEKDENFLKNWAKLRQDAYEKAEARLRVVTLDWNSMKATSTETIRRDKEHIEVLKSSIKRLKEEK